MHVCVCSWKSGVNARAKALEEQGTWYIQVQKGSADLRCAETKENMNKEARAWTGTSFEKCATGYFSFLYLNRNTLKWHLGNI